MLIEVGLGFIFFAAFVGLVVYGAKLEQRIQALENEKERQK